MDSQACLELDGTEQGQAATFGAVCLLGPQAPGFGRNGEPGLSTLEVLSDLALSARVTQAREPHRALVVVGSGR